MRPSTRRALAALLPLLLLVACLDTTEPPPGGQRSLTVDVYEEGGTGHVLVGGELYEERMRVAHGAEVRLQAVPAPGSRLDGFAGCEPEPADSNACTVRMDSDRTVAATFVADGPTFDLTVATNGDGAGEVFVDGEPYEGRPVRVAQGEEVTVRAVPGDDSWLAGFAGCSDWSGLECRVEVDGPEAVTVTFRHADATVEAGTTGSGEGWVRSADGRILCPPSCTAPYGADASVALEALPAVGSRFAGWTGCDATAGSECTVRAAAEGPALATARFAPADGPTFGPVEQEGCGAAAVGEACTVSLRGTGSILVRALELSLPSGAGAFRLDRDAAPTGLDALDCYGAVGPERVAVVCDGAVRLDSLSFDLGLVRRSSKADLLAFPTLSIYTADGAAATVTAGALDLPGGPR